jgi:DNA repair protein RecO (recombination protein O)
MPALYAGYYVAELLADWTEDYDPHPLLFDAAVEVLRDLGGLGEQTGPRLAAFELVLLRELGYSPTLDSCAMCEASLAFETGVAFSPAAGGMICSTCAVGQRERLPISRASWQALRSLAETGLGWQQPVSATVRGEIRRLLGHYVSYRMGRQPKLLPYLASLP